MHERTGDAQHIVKVDEFLTNEFLTGVLALSHVLVAGQRLTFKLVALEIFKTGMKWQA